LAVGGGDEIVPGINALMTEFDTVVLTRLASGGAFLLCVQP